MTPVPALTLTDAYRWTLPEARTRYDELTDRELCGRGVEILGQRGEFDPARPGHRMLAEAEPLSADEHVELIALGERIARYYSHRVLAERAMSAGATPEQIAGAKGCTVREIRDQLGLPADDPEMETAR